MPATRIYVDARAGMNVVYLRVLDGFSVSHG